MSARRDLSVNVRNAIRAVIAALLLVVSAPAFAAAAASLPQPTSIAAQVTSSYQAPCSTNCAVPDLLVQQGTPFLLTVTLSDGTSPAAFPKDTTLTLTAPGPGALSQTSVTMPRGVSSWTFDTVSYAPYANAVTVTAGLPGKKSTGVAATPSNAFDVLQTLKTVPASPGQPFQDGSGPDSCADVTSGNPVCGYVVLPNGSNSAVLLSTGSCAGINCNTGGTVTQLIADLNGLYTPDAPATLIIKCHRSLCGMGGVTSYTAVASHAASGPLAALDACPAKNTLGPTQDACTDYVQSTRDGVDDLLLYVLFDDDFRGSI
jgi:hypothetical protein